MCFFIRLLRHNASHLAVVAKIENREGVDNIREILEEADGIMVARGDLGVEIPPEEVLRAQKVVRGAFFAKISILQFFGGLVLGCIKTKFCKKICVRQLFSSSTRFAYFCTAAISKF